MAKAASGAILQLIHRVLVDPGMRVAPDQELLQRFLGERNEAAFEAILRRHGPMVLDVCRGVLANEADAADAFQATFLVLARKAASIRKAATLASWLHGVAYRTALKARAESTRRREYETRVPEREVSDPDSLTWTEVRRALHEELGQLSGRHREPLVFCYLQGKPQDEAAALLGLSKGTLKRRLERGRALLRQRLVRRGLGPAALLLAAAWPPALASAQPPPALVDGTVKGATLVASGQGMAGAVISPKVIALAQEVLKTMALSKLKHLAVVLVCSAAFVGAVALRSGSAADGPGRAPAVNNLAGNGEVAAAAAPARTTDVESVGGPVAEEQPKPDEKPQKKAASDRPAKAQEVVTKSFTTAKAPRLVVGTFNGPIAVTTGAAGKTEVKVVKTVHAANQEAAEADLKNVDVQMKQEADVIHVIAKPADEQRQTNRGAAVELQVPPGASLELRTQNGTVTARGETGDLTVVTANGGIEVKGSKGPLNLQTSNGSIDIQAVAATATARTSNGSIRFQGSLADGEKRFHTSNGSVVLMLPADASFRVDAQTSNGKASCQFPYKGRDDKSKTGLRATVGDNPKTTLLLRTSNGNIEVRPVKGDGVDKGM